MATIEDYKAATFALVGDRPAMRRDVQSHTPWVMFNSEMVLRMTDEEMLNSDARIVSAEVPAPARQELIAHAEDLQRIIRRRNEEITLLKEVVEKQHQKLEEMERTFEVEKIEGVLSSLAVADEHNGSRNDHQLATLLYGKGMRVVKE